MRAGESEARRKFRACVHARGDETLLRCALLIAAEEYPGLDVDDWIARVDALAEGGRELVDVAQTQRGRVRALSAYFRETLGFRGNDDDYYDPKNSFLNEVIDRRLGIPITMSLIYMEIGRRLDIPFVGVGFPAHFMLKHRDDPDLFVDAFNGGRLLDRRALRRFFQELTEGRVPFEPAFTQALATKQILRRMLMNLAGIYRSRGEPMKALEAVDRIAILEPDDPEVYRDRAMMYLELRAYAFAAEDLRALKERTEDPKEAAVVQRLLDEVRTRVREHPAD